MSAEKGLGLGSPGCSSNTEKSIVAASRRGGVPVFAPLAELQLTVAAHLVRDVLILGVSRVLRFGFHQAYPGAREARNGPDSRVNTASRRRVH